MTAPAERLGRGAHQAANPASAPGIPGLRTVARRPLYRMFGPPPFDATRDRGDPGLTGPGSATWQLIAEPAAIAGGIRGLIVQLSHPLAMAGVADHSSYRHDPLGRLQRTSAWVTTSAFGSTAEAFEVARRVRAIHRRVRGVAADGQAYDAADPHLLAWVSIALTSSFLAADAAWSPTPLTGARADAFVAEQATIAALLDPRVEIDRLQSDAASVARLRAQSLDLPMLTEGRLPTSTAALGALVDGYRDELRLDPAGHDALRFLADPPLPRGARGAYRVIHAGVLASLDGELRDVLGVTSTVRRRERDLRRARRLLALVRAVNGTSPGQRAAAERVHGPVASFGRA